MLQQPAIHPPGPPMTSSSTQRPTSNMTTGTRSRFSNIAMGNGTERSSQPLGTAFPTTSTWQTPGSGIWGSSAIGHFGKPRETVGSKDSSEAFPKVSGSGALAATSEAEPWGSRSGPWNTTEGSQNRNVSGNTSPNRSRVEAPIHDLNSNSTYYPTTQSQMQPAIGQRAPARPKTGTTSDGQAPAFNINQLADYMGDNEDNSGFGSLKYNTEASVLSYPSKRPSQDLPYQSITGNPTRDPGMPTTSHSETDLHTQASSFGELAYGAHTHSQRPSMSFSQSGRIFNQELGQQLDRDEMQSRLANLTLSDGANPASNGLPGLSSYGNGPSQTQFNPLSQPWGPSGQGFPAEYQREVFPSSLSYEKRPSVAERGSSAGSVYRAGQLNSPRSFAGTPQQPSDPWSRPASRDPRNGPELERRGPMQPLMHQQAAPFYHPGYYNGGYQQPYPSHPLYDSFGAGFRQPVPMGYGMPMNPYLASATGIPPMRPSKDQDPASRMRSPLLDEFRSTSKSNKRFELKHIYGHIVEFSGDQHGSRFIQEKLETANSDEKDQVFREIEPNAVQLMKDVFGNYVIQKFFEHGNQVQKKVLAGVMKGKVIDLSTQMYACRVVQKALEHVLVEQQAELAKELEPDVLNVVRNQNGNHVIQKIIELVPRQHIDFIMNCLKGRVSDLSSHTYGCRVIQRVLEHGSDIDKAAIMVELHQCCQMLITDQYGNYVTQHVIMHGKPEDRSRVIAIVTKELLIFSKHKFASNVVEKCIEQGTPEELRRIREGLSKPGDDLSSPLPLLIKDQFGNYVIQKLLNQLLATPTEWEIFAALLRPPVAALKKTTTHRQVAAIDRLINNVPTPPLSTHSTSPSLHEDADSNVPTPPALTTGHNSPSSSPPSTNDGAVGEAAGAAVEQAGSKLPSSDGTPIAQSG